jgi:hypothetical protein
MKVKGAWFYGSFPGNTYYSVAPCLDLILNEGIAGPQYKIMNVLEISKIS